MVVGLGSPIVIAVGAAMGKGKRMQVISGCVHQFPVRSRVLQMELVGEDVCPTCTATLDRAKVCMGCRQDWQRAVPARYGWKSPNQTG
jgi:hypothetical protein